MAVVSEDVDSILVARLTAELQALGISVVLVPKKIGPEPHRELDDLARQEDAAAAVRIAPVSGVVEIWVADRVTGKTVYRQVEIPADVDGSEALIAVRTVELLRASLLEINAPHATQGEVEPAPALKDMTAVGFNARTSRFTLDVGPSLSAGAFGIEPLVHILLGAHVRVTEVVGAELFGMFPLIPTVIKEEEGEADAWSGFLGAGLRLTFSDSDSRWAPSLGAGAGAIFIYVRGQAGEEYTGHDDWKVAFAPHFRGGLSVTLTRTFGIRADLLAAWSVVDVAIRFAGREVAAWDQPLISGFIGAELFFG